MMSIKAKAIPKALIYEMINGHPFWIFTDSEKIMIAEPGQAWKTFNWTTSFEVLEGIEMNIESLLEH
ncbi:MAG TPA: hypothetical protein PKA00_21230 [Saprospiraceae bacterium]|nr:hypothetical protein [Saprospiraceae bacterium]HMQ85447.1 hypothetical protein [Saprospiraceae bacterium]